MDPNSPSSPPPIQDEGSLSPTRPPWQGWIETTGDALLILEAARRGMIPRVTRRLVDSERKMISSGSVFVFDEDESGIKRWTDGFYWSPSRILGNFLLYRETDKKSNLRGSQRSQASSSHTSSIPVNESTSSHRNESSTLSRPKNTEACDVDRARERSLFGSLTNSKKFKSQGMMKKTFSLSIAGVSQHLISYYKAEDIELGRLRTPSSLPELASLEISPEYLDKTQFRVPPRVEYDADGIPRYRGEADEPESPQSGDHGSPGEGPSNAKKRPPKRFEPYRGDSSKSQRRPRSRTGNSTSGVGMQSQGNQSHEGDSPLSSPTTPPLSAGAFDPQTFIGYHSIPGFPGAAANYYPLGFYSGGQPHQTIPFPPFSLPINGGGSNNAGENSNAHLGPTYSTPPTIYTPSHSVFTQNVASAAVHLPAAALMHYYPAVGTWRPAPTDKEDDDPQKSTEMDGHESNTSN